ncbi:MAG: hypothetical protein LC667_18240 [Thioalkalivibrio sp.]|nr:hypothetical protein [Thioalkalivibrio sp.]
MTGSPESGDCEQEIALLAVSRFSLVKNAAQRAYGRGHPRLPELHHDLARLLVLRGRHDRALPLLRRLLGVFTDPPRAAVTHALLAHAAAGLGEAATYERSWAEAWALLDERGAGPAAATVLLHLGKAAALTEDWLRVGGGGNSDSS